MRNNIPFWNFVWSYRRNFTVGYNFLSLLMIWACIRSDYYLSGLIAVGVCQLIFCGSMFGYEWKEFQRNIGLGDLDFKDKHYALSN